MSLAALTGHKMYSLHSAMGIIPDGWSTLESVVMLLSDDGRMEGSVLLAVVPTCVATGIDCTPFGIIVLWAPFPTGSGISIPIFYRHHRIEMKTIWAKSTRDGMNTFLGMRCCVHCASLNVSRTATANFDAAFSIGKMDA